MTPDELRKLVALMRELGISHYEISKDSSIKVVLGGQPRLVAAEEASQGSEQEAPEEVPEAYRRLPAAYRNLALYGGRLPKLDG